MNRMFHEHKTRRVVELDGAWRFVTDSSGIGESRGYANTLPREAVEVIVPSMWNNEFGLLEYEGVAWYEKVIETAGGCVRFCFDGVMTEAKVYLDGALLGSHYGGYTAFSFVVESLAAGRHTLSVRVDNRFDADSIPHAKVDWYHYGGMTRGVRMEELCGVSVDFCHMEYTLSPERDKAKVIFRTELFNATGERIVTPLTVKLSGQTMYKTEVSVGAFDKKTVVSEEIDVSDVHLWDIDDPFLYELFVKTDSDDLYDRVGFREIKAEKGKILLNGREIEIRGVCRHEEHPDWGFAFPEKLMKRDLDIVRDMGCNAIRGSHYPNSRPFLDRLDSEGMLFWSEIPIWGCGYTAEDIARPKVVERGLAMIREMENQYYNHPSIIIWGVHNEIDSSAESAYKMTELYSGELRANGGNRLITHASNHPLTDICFGFDDIICINHYTGWYGGDIKSWTKMLASHIERKNELGLGDKPFIYSEFGGAALYGNHTFDNIKWSEEYQAELFDFCLKLFHDSPEVQGWFIWQFCDMRTCREMGNDRARGFNNKGILNEYRKPKMSYFKIRENHRRFAEDKKS